MPTLKLSLVLLLPLLTCLGCAAFQSGTAAVLTADDLLAQALCAESHATERSIDLDEARETYCDEREQWRPWLEAAAELRATEQYQRARDPG